MLEVHEKHVPFVQSSKDHKWRRFVVFGTFAVLSASTLLGFFLTADSDYNDYDGLDCYSNGSVIQSFSGDGFTNVTAQFDMVTQFGAAMMFFYIFVGCCICIKPLFCISQLLFHLTNMLMIIFLIVITCVMN